MKKKKNFTTQESLFNFHLDNAFCIYHLATVNSQDRGLNFLLLAPLI